MLIYTIDPTTRQLSQVGDVDAGQWSDNIYGLCLYHSPTDGKYYAIASGKNSQLRQWELVDNGNGTIVVVEKRTWSNGSGATEGLVADDETGKLYACNEDAGIRKYDADPTDQNPALGEFITQVGENGLVADVEGIAIYYAANGEGFIIVSSQGNDSFKVYNRKPPHAFVKTFTVVGAQHSDGLDVTNINLGSSYTNGMLTLHTDSASGQRPHPIMQCAYEDIGLPVDTEYWNPRTGGADPTPTPLVFRVERSTGDVFAQGSFISDGADLAERIDVSEPVEPGDVVELDPSRPGYYRKARGSRHLIAGVITTKPGFTLGNRPNEMESATVVAVRESINSETGNRPMFALMGRVPVKTTTENGPIRPGDLLTVSSTPGCAMRCPEAKECEGAIIGKALEALESGEGLILVLVMSH